jgi:hypothetical protein
MSGRGAPSGRGSHSARGRGSGSADPPHSSSSREHRPPSSTRTKTTTTNTQSGEADWQDAKTAGQRRRERAQQWELERREKYPALYAAGLTDAEVRATIEAREAKTKSTGSNAPRGHRPGGSTTGSHQKRPDVRGRQDGAPRQTPSGSGGRSEPSAGTPGKRRHDGSSTGATPPAKFTRQSVLTGGGGAPPPTYAAMAAAHEARRKPREHFPHMLRVHQGKEKRCPITEEAFQGVAEILRKQVLAYVKEPDHIILRTAFTRWSKDGGGMIACKTEETKAWYQEAVAKIDIGGVTYRAWEGANENQLRPARINVTNLGLDPTEILDLIKGLNPKLKGMISLLRPDAYTSRVNNQQIILLGMDDTAAASLGTKDEPWIVELGTDQRRVSYSGKKDLATRLVEQGQNELAEKLRDTSLSQLEDMEEETEDVTSDTDK